MRAGSKQKGDTILEVLVVITALSLILTASFALANRNVLSTRQAAERGEAYKHAESSVEGLKLYITAPGAELPAVGEYFCLSSDLSEIFILGSETDGPENVNDDVQFTSPIYAAAENRGCKVDGELYYSFLQRATPSEGLAENTYKSIVRWPSVTGNGVDQVNIYHKLYPDTASGPRAIAGSPIITPVRCLENNNIAVALDRSGSMLDDYQTARETKFDAAKRILGEFVVSANVSSGGNRIALTGFGADRPLPGRVLQPNMIVPIPADRTQPSNLNTLQNGLATMDTQKLTAFGTNMMIGLDVTYNHLRSLNDPGAQKIIILMTDGRQDNTSTTIEQVIARANQIKGQGYTIYAIGIYPGGTGSARDRQNLQAIASPPSGSDRFYTSASSSSELDNFFARITNQLECSP